jgi:hypothetical protein
MKPIEFIWREGAGTVQEPLPGSRILYIRHHKNADEIPGEIEYSGIVEIYADGSYEYKLFSINQNIPHWLELILRVLRKTGLVSNAAGTGRGPYRSELIAASRFIESLPGVRSGSWRRAKRGRVKTVPMSGV